MRRFHVHVAVDDIPANTAFYTGLFGPPSRVEPDYVKWILEDPRLNFAISSRGHVPGVNHLGLQVDSDEELRDLKFQLDAANLDGKSEAVTDCCYSTSDKYWVTDPQGVAWETYHTLSSIPTFGGQATASCGFDQNGCCAHGDMGPAREPVRAKGCCG